MGDLELPHFLDPGAHNKVKKRDVLDFKVRVGTSLARSNIECQAVLIDKEFKTENIFWSENIIQNKNFSRRTTPSNSRRSSIDTGNMSGISFIRKRRRNYGSLLWRLDSASERLMECHSNPGEALKKFRKVVRTVKMMCAILRTLKSYVEKPDISSWSFMEMYLHIQEGFKNVLTFSKNNYGKIEPLKDKLKKLLSIAKPYRTKQDVQTIMGLMRDNLSFQDYPVHIQIKLSRCMEYQSYEPKRVILKQGHRPFGFYIMLSGVALVNIKDFNPHTGNSFVRTVGQLEAGDTFGEIALIEGGFRTASVVCKTMCEFLVIQKHDFDEIIKKPLLQEREDHIKFCKSLPFLEDFPCEIFRSHTKEFFFQYFKNDDVIVKNSVTNKFRVIVKSGKCKLVSDFKEQSSRKGLMLDQDVLNAFPLFTTLLKVKSRAPVPKSGSTDTVARLHIGLLTGTLDRTALAENADKKLNEVEEQNMTQPSVKFAQISELNSGDVFGLESLVSRPSTTLSLVSEGSECLFISKRLFLSVANIKVLRIVNDLVQNYPCHSYIREQVISYRKWQQYKKDLEEEVLVDHRRESRVWIGGVPAS